MSKHLSTKNKTFLCLEITYNKGDKIDKLNLSNLKNKITNDLVKTHLVKKKDILDFSENKEDIVYPIQFVDYKKKLADTKSNISKFHQLYSIGTGGDFNYADSQILFHKSLDLVKILTDDYNKFTNVKKTNIAMKLNKTVKLVKKKVGFVNKTYNIAEQVLTIMVM